MRGFGAFTVGRLPRIVFGAGAREALPAEVRALGERALVVTGRRSLRATPHWRRLLEGLSAAGVAVEDAVIEGEPSPETVDDLVAAHRGRGIAAVLGIGGGSVLDAAKAAAGLLESGSSAMDHLEGVGRGVPYKGPAVPFIAVPTTAGTGSEATRNAVLGRCGPDGFKKSFRDERLVARLAVVDPDLLAGCPPDLVAADGMDAFTQLVESLVSARAGPLTDALAWSGLEAWRDGFRAAWRGRGAEAEAGRERMAYAALVSGIALAQTGLGAVHGLAAPLGAFFPIPHGVACGTLVAEVSRANLAALEARVPDSPALAKYARLGRLLAGPGAAVRGNGLENLLAELARWQKELALPRLGRFGMGPDDIARVVDESGGSSMKTNPVILTPEELAGVLAARL